MENIENKIPNGENQDTQNSSFFSENVSSSNGLEPKLRFKEFDGKWSRNILGNCCDIIMGQSPDSSSYNNNCIGLPLVQGNADMCERIATPQRYTSQPTKICEAGSIILSVRAPVGTVGKTFQKICLGRGVCGITSKNIEFMYQYLLNNENSWRHIEQGGTFTAINSDDIKSFPIILPSLPEQKKIADFLSLIDQRIEKQRQLVENLKKYKRGLVFHLFNKNNPINKSIPMRDLLTEINDRNSVGLRVCSVAVIKGIVDQIEHLGRSFSASDTSKYRRVHFGDVVYTKSPTGDFPFGIVKQSKIKEDVAVSPLYGVYKPSSYSTGNLLHLYFEQYQYANNYIRSLAQKGAKNTINITTQHFLEKNIIFPYNEVDRVYFSNFFEKLNKLIKFNEGELEKAQSLKKGLLQQMFI